MDSQASLAARVFIAQDNRFHSYFPAERWGRLVHCLPSSADHVPWEEGDDEVRYATRVARRMHMLTTRMRTALQDFDPQVDYLLLSGAPVVSAIALAILHERFDSVRILNWVRQDQDYRVLMVNLMANGGGNADRKEVVI